MLTENSLKGSINSPERQLLWDIRELLKETNKLLAANLESQSIENKPETVDIKPRRGRKPKEESE